VTDHTNLAYVDSSQYRRGIVQQLADGDKIPSEMADEMGYSRAHTSRALTQLRKEGLVELLVDEDTKRNRYYGLTETGEQVVEKLAEVE